MLISDPTPSPYDWNFRFLGFPIRVTWLFWVVAAALGYRSAMDVDDGYQAIAQRIPEFSSPGLPVLLCIWIAATLASILIHELGHALAFRFYGIQSQIVLYHMGGLAIPMGGYLYPRQGRRRELTAWNQIVVSAAGPGLQLLSGLAVAAVAMASGIDVPTMSSVLNLFGWSVDFANGLPENAMTYGIVEFYVLISIWWPLFNLLPVYPLDGGHIAQNIIAIIRRTDGLFEANAIGAIVGFAVAWWFFSRGSTFNALLFVSLAMTNVQSLQQHQGPRF